MTSPLRIAMWSGPRNMSTTMMRSFGARDDTSCVDEPFYAAYLTATKLIHPMQEAILAAQSSAPEAVACELTEGPCPAPIHYQKQMTHHFLDSFPTDWMGAVDHHVFLTRHPTRVIASYARKMENVSLEAIGFPQQLRIARLAEDITGKRPIVIDSDDILRDPANMLKKLCDALGIVWDSSMLSWTSGPKPEDGVWAPHWYDAVNASTGFAPPPGPLPVLSDELVEINEKAMPIYDTIGELRLLA